MGAATVSTITPTFNSLELLKECLGSIFGQSLPQSEIEIIVVDDGSTDGTWDYLQSLRSEHPNLVALRQENSGRPSVGRNRGLEVATGEFIFFVDSDDWFSAESLERLVTAARVHGSDVVVGRAVGDHRQVQQRTYLHTVYDADLLDDGAWRTLSPWKLFRSSLIRQLGLRFPEDMVQGEDQVFVSQCYFAGKVSILADYDYYHVRGREDGRNVSKQPQTLQNKLLTVTRMADIITANTEPGPRRSRHFRRVIFGTLAPGLGKPFMAAPVEEQDEFLRRIRQDVLPNMRSKDLAAAADRPRLRLAAALKGTSAQVAALNRQLADGPLLTIRRGRPHLDLGRELNALIPAQLRQVQDVWKLRHRFDSLSNTNGTLAVTYRLEPAQLGSRILRRMPPELELTSRGASPATVSITGQRQDDFRWQFAWGAELLPHAPSASTIWDARLVLADGSSELAASRAVYRGTEGPAEARAIVVPAPEDGTAVWLEAYTTIGGSLSIRQDPQPKATAAKAVSFRDGKLEIELPGNAGAVRGTALLTAEGWLPVEHIMQRNGQLAVQLPNRATAPAEPAGTAAPLVLQIDCERAGCQLPLAFSGNAVLPGRWPAGTPAPAGPAAARLVPGERGARPPRASRRPKLVRTVLAGLRRLRRHAPSR